MFYAVTAKCGHSGLGKDYYVPITFAIISDSAPEAAEIGRNLPRVKHDHKDAILDVQLVNAATYIEIWNRNEQDPFLISHSIQEQRRLITIDEMLARAVKEVESDCENEKTEKRKYFAKKKELRNPRKFCRYSEFDGMEFSRIDNL
jgi:hypothetical protein